MSELSLVSLGIGHYRLSVERMPYNQRNPGYPPPAPPTERGSPGQTRHRQMPRNTSFGSLDSNSEDMSAGAYGPPGEVIYMQSSPGVGRPPIKRGPSTSGDFTHSGLPPRAMPAPLHHGPSFNNGMMYNPNPQGHILANSNSGSMSRASSHSRSGSFTGPPMPPPIYPQTRPGMPPLMQPHHMEPPSHPLYPPSRSISRSLSRSGSFRSPSPPSPVIQGTPSSLVFHLYSSLIVIKMGPDFPVCIAKTTNYLFVALWFMFIE